MCKYNSKSAEHTKTGHVRKPPSGIRDIQARITGLEETGRLQYFFHCSASPLPIRDVVKRRKTEPHIEAGAENWCNSGLKRNIKGFLTGPEKYLFLFTRCDSGSRAGKYCVVGYIENRAYEPRRRGGETWYAVMGPVKIFSFDDSYLLQDVKHPRHVRLMQDAHDTAEMLKHFQHSKNILTECVQEIQRLDPERITCRGDDCSRRNAGCPR